jgi:hypothetical protein
LESSEQRTIEKIEKFCGISTPVVRFRYSLNGPCLGEYFGKLIIDFDERKKWDQQIAHVQELIPLNDLDSANIAMGFGKYGDCSRLGIGYGQTKAGLGLSPREQLFMYGLQEFEDGAFLIWGIEMDEKYDFLLPKGPRHTRAKSHLFAATLAPTSENQFDIEYVLQMDVGGSIPTWITTPVVIDSVKSLFSTAEREFAGKGDGLSKYKQEQELYDAFANKASILIPH